MLLKQTAWKLIFEPSPCVSTDLFKPVTYEGVNALWEPVVLSEEAAARTRAALRWDFTLIIQPTLTKYCTFQGSSPWDRTILFLSLRSFHEFVHEVLSCIPQYGVEVCALRLRAAGGVDFCVILPPPPLPQFVLSTLPLFLSLSLFLPRSLSFCLAISHPSYAPSHPSSLLLPHLQCKYTSLPCWTCDEKVAGSRAPPRLLFHHQQSISALHRALVVCSSLSFSLCLSPSLSFSRPPSLLFFFLCFACSPLSAPATCKGET